MSAPSPSGSATAASKADGQPYSVTGSPPTATLRSSSDHSTTPPPIALLHRHALESVFAFLSLRELTFALSVSRDWTAAVRSMGRMELKIRRPVSPLVQLAQSTMSRHVGRIKLLDLTDSTLAVLATRMAHLRELHCTLALPPSDEPLAFPAALRRLNIDFVVLAGAIRFNAATAAIGRLPLLEELTIRLDELDPQFSFAPLAALPLLGRLEIIRPRDGAELALSDAQVDQLRALPQLREVKMPMTTALLRRLLRQPHQLRWHQISLPVALDDEAAALLLQLPLRTSINAVAQCDHFDWLRGLPNLSFVSLSSGAAPGDVRQLRVASMVAGLQHCTRIQTLMLCNPELTVAQLAELLPRLPQLRSLQLAGLAIDSLSFLAQPPLTNQLRSLSLMVCRRLPPAELHRVQALRALNALTVFHSFSAPVDQPSLALYWPPSAALPQLEKFSYTAGPHGYSDSEEDE
jgi:hypothetical protein